MNGLVGLSLSFGIGTKYLDMTVSDVLIALLGSNIAALVAIFLTLKAERISWISKRWLNRSLKSWALLVFLYMGTLLSFSPSLLNPHHFIFMIFPLILSTGFAIIVFGPIQDRLVIRRQKNSQSH